MRLATEVAAMRRGCVWPISRPLPGGALSLPRPSSSTILGNWVVLPEPVSPQTMTTWFASMAALISSRRADTGRDSGNSIRRGDEDKAGSSGKIADYLSPGAPASPHPANVHRLQLHFRALVPLGRALHPHASRQDLRGRDGRRGDRRGQAREHRAG